ncbi:RalA-binding protein 1 [Clonorchis sinensis]|uniref:RalA-binding protein 1 n=1 Tax=Clonorchis sinensis TaxID=79923 RepID=A0A419PLK1_CLOSI|nr:RalA-binding protein 1 [Clonorchis sinensis]
MEPSKSSSPLGQLPLTATPSSMTTHSVNPNLHKTPTPPLNSSGRTKQGLIVATTAEGSHTKPPSKKTKSSFRLPGTKKRRKDKKLVNSELDSALPPTGDHPVSVADRRDPSPPASAPEKTRASEKMAKKQSVGLRTPDDEPRKSHRKSKRGSKLSASKTYTKHSFVPETPVFGVPLNVAIQRDPSFDGVPLPAFFRHCIDYLEKYGLSSEGIYRVPGVNSQIQALVAALDRGESFPQVAPTSAAFYQQRQQHSEWPRVRPSLSGTPGSESKIRVQSVYGGPSKSKGFVNSPLKLRLTGERQRTGTAVGFSISELPHELPVIASVVKHFLRSLPEPVMTSALRPVVESLPPELPQIYYTLAELVHKELPRPNRFLLAWLLQHMTHIIDRAGENLMTLANISIVLSPSLQISHRLLAILLTPPPPDVRIDLAQLDPDLPAVNITEVGVDPSMWHWLFPHPVYLLRPYRPPLTPGPDLDLPETDAELDEELKKQELLLQHLHEQIGRGEATNEKEAQLWEVQRLVTELRRRKAFSDPEVIRAELSRQQAQLDRLHEAIAAEQARPSPDSPMWISVNLHPSHRVSHSDINGQKRRDVSSSKASKHRSDPASSYSDELWEVQRQVTMLKRRLKQQEKLVGQQTVSTTGPASDAATAVPTTTTTSKIVMSGSIPLVIPTVSELDEEEVLNLTLRKLPLDAPSGTTFASTGNEDTVVLTQPPLPDTTLVRVPSTRLPASDVEKQPHSPIDSPRTIRLVRPADNAVEQTANDVGEIDTKQAMTQEEELKREQASADHTIESQTPLADNKTMTEQETAVDTVLPAASVTEVTTQDAQIQVAPPEQIDDRFEFDVTVEHTALSEKSAPAVAPALPPSPWRTSSSGLKVEPSLFPVDRQIAQQIAFYTARKQELQAINTDLRARIWSENAEISRIQSCISHLLETGGKRVQRIYETQFNSTRIHPTSTQADGTEHSLATWLDHSWTRIAERLSAVDYGSSGKEASCLMDEPDGSDLSDSTSKDDDDEFEEMVDESQPVAYSRLTEEYDDDEEHRGKINGYSKLDDDGSVPSSDLLPVDVETDGEDDDDDDDEDEGEAELARTLHQLTMDNARLEQLNCRYLEGIQAERNRCAELKVLLKLRNTTVGNTEFNELSGPP